MPKNMNIAHIPVPKNKLRKLGLTGALAAGAAAVAVSVIPAGAEAAPTTQAAAVSVAPVAYTTNHVQDVKTSLTDQMASASVKAQQAKAVHQAAVKAEANKKAAVEKSATVRTVAKAAAQPKVKSYPNTLDGWIRQSLDIMHKNHIPGTYHGLYKNIMRESSGNPKAINLWDINARNGIPSKGLLQVIPPTFATYHVNGTKNDIYDPVANIVAACNYAAHRYGSMDNVNSAY